MHVAVCLVPILDPQISAGALTLDDRGRQLVMPKAARNLSPFEEAALEIGFRFRDSDPTTRVSVTLIGGSEADERLRYVMALKPDSTARLEPSDPAGWDPFALCRALRTHMVDVEPPPDLILMGPQFGDLDDGVVPAFLAETLGWQYFSSAGQAREEKGAVVLVRDCGNADEQVTIKTPLVATVTTHPATRLRLPLLKNIMAANRQSITKRTFAATEPEFGIFLESLETVKVSRRGAAPCKVLQGNLAEQVAALVDALAPWRRSS
jgi:electron transfer flavoprotein beta subunit